jgi:alpha-galactosidase/6-phospho-beta-glucosidase family protein
MNHRAILSFLLMLFLFQSTQAQEKPRTDDTTNPNWISMMQDPQVNYYEAVKAFDAYWEGKIEPEEEDELITEGKITSAEADSLRNARASWTQVQRNEYENIKYQFKRFKDWKRTAFPFVQSDGRILSEQERLEIFQKQQQVKDK